MRLLSGSTVRLLLALSLTLPWACTSADAPEKYVLDQQYREVREPLKPADPNKVLVMEVFSYTCPHCFRFEPLVQKWKATMPAGVVFVQQPWSLGQQAALPRSKAAHAAEQLGVFEKFHRALFAAIHGQGKVMATPSELQELFVSSTGLDAQQFNDAFSGFATDSHVRKAEAMIRDLGITSVPTVVVDGRWYVNGQLAGGNDKVFDVVDFLVAKAKAERKPK